ncbi:GNAT family N-acetyltransferase [Flavobacterium olei]|uniref:GNAT family N-acetyltransferase n=1 Tax=Flavobacterium olei TaxID=1886782 RepID=UPI00321ABFD6
MTEKKLLKTTLRVLCFVGEPNSAGEVEIGYGTYETFRKKGYMTEAVGGIIDWAGKQPNIKTIVASTDKTNQASSSVLEKNNFLKIGQTENLNNWALRFHTGDAL